MAFGCLCVAAAYLADGGGRRRSGAGKASPLWLVGYFVLATLGELCLAPIGLALIVTIAPARIRSMMMGVWFAATLPADILAGYLGGFWSSMAKADFFLLIAAIAAVAGAALWAASHVPCSRCLTPDCRSMSGAQCVQGSERLKEKLSEYEIAAARAAAWSRTPGRRCRGARNRRPPPRRCRSAAAPAGACRPNSSSPSAARSRAAPPARSRASIPWSWRVPDCMAVLAGL